MQIEIDRIQFNTRVRRLSALDETKTEHVSYGYGEALLYVRPEGEKGRFTEMSVQVPPDILEAIKQLLRAGVRDSAQKHYAQMLEISEEESMKHRIVGSSEIAKHPNLSLRARDYVDAGVHKDQRHERALAMFHDIREGIRSDIPGIHVGPEDENGCQLSLSGNKSQVFVELLEFLYGLLTDVSEDTETSRRLKELYNRMIA